MSYLIISNGVTRKPHVEEVESIEDVTTRVAHDPESFMVIEGRIVSFHKEEFLFVDSDDGRNVTLDKQGDEDGGQHIPRWRAPVTEGGKDDGQHIPRWRATTAREAEHLPAVEEHTGGEADDTFSDRVDQGPDQGGTGDIGDDSVGDDGQPE